MFLLALSQFWFGGDVSALGDREWRTREAAQKRLAENGWLAVPAVWRGMNDQCPERSQRCHLLWAACSRWPNSLAKLVLDNPSVPISGDWSAGGFGEVLCAEIDQRRGWETTNSWMWVSRTPYRTGTREGDFQLVIETARGRSYTSASR